MHEVNGVRMTPRGQDATQSGEGIFSQLNLRLDDRQCGGDVEYNQRVMFDQFLLCVQDQPYKATFTLTQKPSPLIGVRSLH